jgi:hypothetical protein
MDQLSSAVYRIHIRITWSLWGRWQWYVQTGWFVLVMAKAGLLIRERERNAIHSEIKG